MDAIIKKDRTNPRPQPSEIRPCVCLADSHSRHCSECFPVLKPAYPL
jgi:hypothetical protein